jgi:hypothetical protein
MWVLGHILRAKTLQNKLVVMKLNLLTQRLWHAALPEEYENEPKSSANLQ